MYLKGEFKLQPLTGNIGTFYKWNELINWIKKQSHYVLNNNLHKENNMISENVRMGYMVDQNHPYDSEIFDQHVKLLLENYSFIKKKIIGYSTLNKPIIELQIGNGKTISHFNASFHGNEWITSAILMSCVNLYAENILNRNKFFIDSFQHNCLSFVPMVNPDGVDLVIHGSKKAGKYENQLNIINRGNDDFQLWKANIRGVDLNKQFPANWDIEAKRKPKIPHFRDYPGKIPFSETESIAMKLLVEENDFTRVHALHTQGEEIYWGFNDLEPYEAKLIAEQYANKTNYKAVQHIDNYAGFKDWFIQTYRRPGFTIELGKGTNPLPMSQFNSMFIKMWAIFIHNLTY